MVSILAPKETQKESILESQIEFKRGSIYGSHSEFLEGSIKEFRNEYPNEFN